MKSDVTRERRDNRVHQHYTQWFVGDGAKTEFLLEKTYEQFEDLDVFVDGLLKRPDVPGTAYDYQLRGLTSGYDGEKNAVKFNVAPANTDNVCVRIIST
jgi:hypothetical protein